MIGRELKILIKTFADATGLTKLGAHMKAHSVVVKGLVKTYEVVASAGKFAFSLLTSELRMVRNAALAAAAAITGITIKGVRDFMKADDAAQGLKASLASLGYNADKLMPKFEKMAGELQDLTRIGDDEILSLQGILLNFGIAPEKIDRVTKGTIGLATALRMDLGSAAQYVSLSQQGQYDMLARYIPALRAAKTESEKMAIVNKVMAAGYEQAQLSAGQLAGRYDQMKNRIGDLWEKIGQTVSEAINLTDIFHKAERAVKRFTEAGSWDTLKQKIRNAFADVSASVKTLWDLIEKIQSGEISSEALIKTGRTAVREIVTFAVTLLLELLKANVDVFIALAKIMVAVFREDLEKIPVIGRQMKKPAVEERARQRVLEETGVDLGKRGIIPNAEKRKWSDAESLFVKYTSEERSRPSGFRVKESVANLETAVAGISGKIGEAVERTTSRYKGMKENINTSFKENMGVNLDLLYAQNRAKMGIALNTLPGEEPEDSDKARLLAAFQQRKAKEEADLERVLSRYGNSTNVAVLNAIGKERDDVVRVNKEISLVVSGNMELLESMFGQLKIMNENTKKLQEQVKRLPL